METLNDLPRLILKINIQKLKEKEVEFRNTFDPEAIHDMRVAVRRLRAAIKTFKSILPSKAKKIRTDLKEVGRILGKKRDLDVFYEFIRHIVDANSTSLKKIPRENERSEKQVLSMLNSKKYKKIIESLKELKPAKTKLNILKAAKNRIRKELKKVLKRASAIDPKVGDKTLHKFRISLKKLRYNCEFFEPIFNKYIYFISPFIKKTKKIQDILGDHQDSITGILMLIQYKNKFSGEEYLKIKQKFELKKKRARRLLLKVL